MEERPVTLHRKPLFERVEEGFQAALAYAEGAQKLRESWVPAVAPPHLRSGQEIKELREHLGLTPDTLAQILSISSSSLLAYERGQRKPPGSVLRLLDILERVDKPTLGTILKAPDQVPASRGKIRASS